MFYPTSRDEEPQGLGSPKGPDCSRGRHFLCGASSRRISSAGGPSVIREGLCGLISAEFSLLSSQLPQPTAVNTPQARGEQLLFPGRVQKRPPRSASPSGLDSQPGGWGGELGGEFGHGGGRNNPRPSLLCPVWKIPAPEALLPLR